MSVSLRELIEAGGFDLRTLDDAIWLKSREKEFDELLEAAEEKINKAEEREAAEIWKEYERRWS